MILDRQTILSLVATIKKAGKIAVDSRKSPEFKVTRKSDNSKLSTSDLLVDKYLKKILSKLTPNISIISEESIAQDSHLQENSLYWLIDPIDGTSNFCAGGDEFTINIALMKDGFPIFGAIHAPIYDGGKTAYIDENNNLVIELPTSQNRNSEENIVTVSKNISDEKTESFVEKNLYYEKNNYKMKKISSSVKFFEILQGNSDIFLMLHNTSEWDIAAGHALINALGGSILEASSDELSEFQELRYSKKDFLNNYLIISSKYGKETCIKL